MRSSMRSVALLFLASQVAAVTPVSDAEMESLLASGGVRLAARAQPMFLMGQMLDHPPCIPTFATIDNKQASPSRLCIWPDAGCDCRIPSVPPGNPLPSLPVYFSYSRCSSTSVRVAYNLFYTKDGFQPEKLFGHPFDWERVVVIWDKGDDGWTPSQLLLSQHTGYKRVRWDEIQSTLSRDDAALPRGGCNGVKNLDHPKVFIASAKHDNHLDKKTAFVDLISQLTDNAFRSDDWWYFPKEEDYVLADRSTPVGQLIGSFQWGDADSTPPVVADGLCNA